MDKVGGFFAVEGSSSVDCAQIIDSISTKLKSEGYAVEVITFPEPNTEASYFANNYLQDKYSGQGDMHPYSSSIFYALERFEAASRIRELVSAGYIVLVNRYSSFSMAKYGVEFSNPEERRGYYIWLDNLDFVLLNNPRPDTTFILDASNHAEQTQRTNQLGKLELGTNSIKLLGELCNYYPKDFTHIDCARNDKQISNEQIVSILWDKLSTVLPTSKQIAQDKIATATNNTNAPLDFYIPESLDDDTKTMYEQEIDIVLSKHSQIVKALRKQSATNPNITEDQIQQISSQVLPVAIRSKGKRNIVASVQSKTKLQKLIDQNLPGQYGQMEQKVRLINVTPKKWTSYSSRPTL